MLHGLPQGREVERLGQNGHASLAGPLAFELHGGAGGKDHPALDVVVTDSGDHVPAGQSGHREIGDHQVVAGHLRGEAAC